LKILAKYYDLLAVRFHCQLLYDLQNLFEFLIVIQFRCLVERFLLAMVGDVFTAQHRQLPLTM
jgi:hypothetical protein